MSKLLRTSHFTFSAILSRPIPTTLPIHLSNFLSPPNFSLCPKPLILANSRRNLSIRAFNSTPEAKNEGVVSKKEEKTESRAGLDDNGSFLGDKADGEDYPSGEFEFQKPGAWKSFVVKLRMLIAFPWQRVKKGSVLTMKLRGQISDQLKSRFSSGLSLPQICENFTKAAYDPRISGIYLHIEPLNCGWGKVEEIRRHILDFKKSGQ